MKETVKCINIVKSLTYLYLINIFFLTVLIVILPFGKVFTYFIFLLYLSGQLLFMELAYVKRVLYLIELQFLSLGYPRKVQSYVLPRITF